MSDLIVGLGIALVFEGLLWALAPDAARRMLRELSSVDNSRLRPVAWGAVAAGLFLVWAVRG
jgi:uncharacterized protein